MRFHSLPSMSVLVNQLVKVLENGICCKPKSRDSMLNVEAASRVMSLQRLKKILSFIHLNDTENMPKRDDSNINRLYKLRPMIDYLNITIMEVFIQSIFLNLEGSMLGFEGRSALKQYLPCKPTKRVCKIWVLTCGVTGFMLCFDGYQDESDTREKNERLGENIMMTLSKAFEGLGY